MAKATAQYTDASNERSTVGIHSASLTSANLDAQLVLWSNLRLTMTDLSLGEISQHSIATQVNPAFTTPTDPFAQREIKWLVTYAGATTGKKFQLEIPCADLGGGHLVAGTDIADTGNADWAAFITDFELFAKSPDDVNEAVTFLSARLVGRNI